MKNKEIEELLNKLKNKAEHYILYDYEVKLLLSYIEQLEKDNQCKYRNCCDDIYECSYAEYQEMCNKNMEMALKLEQLEKKAELGEHYKHLYSEVKKQKDDVVEYIKKNKKVITKYEAKDTRLPIGTFMWNIDEVLRMLGEIE